MRHGAWTDSQPLQVMPSIGIALYPQDGDSVETLLKHADAAMYEAKRAGRSTYRFFERSMNEAATRTLQIQNALHDALAAGHFSLHFQPKFHGGSDSLAGAEALIRLNHPQLGSLAPLEFIPIAERSGQIVQIGYWVVRETCRQIRALDRAGPAGDESGDQPVAAPVVCSRIWSRACWRSSRPKASRASRSCSRSPRRWRCRTRRKPSR